MQRHLFNLGLCLIALTAPLQAQWEIFAQRTPVDGSWSTYRIVSIETDGSEKVDEIRVSSRDGTIVEGIPMIWLEISPVKWLGSKNKGRLSFLIPREMTREKAARLIHISRQILFTDPVRGPWYMFPEDVSDVVKLVEMKDAWVYTPLETKKIKDGAGKKWDCVRETMRGDLSLNPPLFRAITTVIEGEVWRSEAAPFGVVKAQWVMNQKRGSDTDIERRRVELIATGRETTLPPPIVHGERFTYWKLIQR